MRPVRWRVLCAVTVMVAASGLAGMARACGIDGVPSLSANGALAHPMTSKPSRSELTHWAPFMFPTTFQAGQVVHFSENIAELRRSLPAQAFGHPWRWRFGDGAVATGTVVAHTYRRAGEYRVMVWADYSQEHFWYEFDAAMINIH